MTVVRKVDLTADIFKGEVITFKYPPGSAVELFDPTSNKIEYEYPYPDIDTNDWEVGIWTAIIKTEHNYNVVNFELVDPAGKANRYRALIKIIEDIDNVMMQRATGNNVIVTSINNKSLTYESSDVLLRLRATYVAQANSLAANLKGLKIGCPIKSLTSFKR
ncbi:hypothetical protein RJ495_000725 [Pluralibacter gergoviae]|nr:hypothetical protein [Pluralibacter gergoviae]